MQVMLYKDYILIFIINRIILITQAISKIDKTKVHENTLILKNSEL